MYSYRGFGDFSIGFRKPLGCWGGYLLGDLFLVYNGQSGLRGWDSAWIRGGLARGFAARFCFGLA